ncbi:DUF4179 domain-containing protein [Natranaerobius trueperi]|uniref:DUF4179 domain-containing protein n=1 Tax=Natranaerobius trueperi TaxID=759412 RepID=A0A226BZM4_9FIRM|nr:DUF4179 domain-containing protein [Natranaerobius trueperi]OWZ84436.1 hypothetical protein CDO51_02725 [Natranaerobius trueperi]
MKIKRKLQKFKEDYYNSIDIPEEIDDYLMKGVEKGMHEKARKNHKIKKIGISVAASVMLLFTVSINTMPTFANAMHDIPVAGQLVRVLHFSEEPQEGGKITDGSDVEFISLVEKDDKEHIVINFSQDLKEEEFASHYEIDHSEYPHTLDFKISGVREFSAEDEFEKMKDGNMIKDIYRQMTLDDSMVRFSITMDKPFSYQVTEYKEPGQLVVTLEEKQESKEDAIYSIRSESYPHGEKIGIVEEQIFSLDNRRMLKDEDGEFLIEVDQFNSKEKAEEKKNSLTEEYPVVSDFVIEKRGTSDIPKNY